MIEKKKVALFLFVSLGVTLLLFSMCFLIEEHSLSLLTYFIMISTFIILVVVLFCLIVGYLLNCIIDVKKYIKSKNK